MSEHGARKDLISQVNAALVPNSSGPSGARVSGKPGRGGSGGGTDQADNWTVN